MDLQLTCPSCEQDLVLDAGFAGGVCRCSNCGTLMTVPHAAAATDQTTPIRPDHPGVPNEPPIAPLAELDAPTPTLEPFETPATESNLFDKKPTTAPSPGLAASKSATGRRQPSSPTDASGAHVNKRLIIHAAVISILVLGSGLLALAVRVLYRHEVQKSSNGSSVVVEFDYDPDANPFLLDNPNLLGLPLSRRSAIVVDAPQTSSPWLGLVKQAIISGTDFDTQAVSIQLAFTHPDWQSVFPESPTTLTNLPRNDMHKYLNSHLAMGVTDPVNTIRNVLTAKPTQLLLVTGQPLSVQHVKAIRRLLQHMNSTRFDTVTLDDHNADLQKLTADYDGHYVRVTSQQLSNWRYASH